MSNEKGATPETDAVIVGGTIGQLALLEHARALERQRDAARRELAEANNAYAAVEQVNLQLQAELAAARLASEDSLLFVVEYRRKPEHGSDAWNAMASFDYEGPAEAYVKSCSADDPPWEYRIRPVEKGAP